jgi:hypothetical protein
MKRMFAVLSVAVVLAVSAFAQTSQLKKACCTTCCTDKCSDCCKDGCTMDCCKGK